MSNDEIRNTDNTNKAKSSKWEGPEPEKNQWEGPEPSKSENRIPKRNDTARGNSPLVSQQKAGNKALPIIIAVIAAAFWGLVVIVIAGIIFWKSHNSSVSTTAASVPASETADDYSSDEDTEDTEDSEEQEDNEDTFENESGATEENDTGKSGTGHKIILNEDPIDNPFSGFSSVSTTSDAFHGYGFVYDGDVLTYNDNNFTSRLGIDVSSYQGTIDWHKVREAGVKFAFIRLGYRGYGEEGNISLDKQFEYNLENALAEGIDVGVYFFSQALDEDEAREEAEFVISTLKEYGLDNETGIKLPVAYDLITATDMGGRTNDLTLEEYAGNAQAFCRTMSQASYQTTIAFNEDQWPDLKNELGSLSLYSFWYGNYNITDQVMPPFTYDFLQFSNKGKVPGIDTDVDMDIQILKR
ncbi:MAG: hypothetical protein K5986_12325 [Clostridium sp.]|nr:hypothetical protein [Clostridium sp.]